jgi:hypothetical protein
VIVSLESVAQVYPGSRRHINISRILLHGRPKKNSGGFPERLFQEDNERLLLESGQRETSVAGKPELRITCDICWFGLVGLLSAIVSAHVYAFFSCPAPEGSNHPSHPRHTPEGQEQMTSS